ncbi:conserved hypothetical protein [Talaromyces marneffei ATCC 18224]|uniref:Uncharacterized protein n=1 Tax=Talaromyces marneffei (strain ATCC 18224 / CBS 334.59 / QM 7333) TaxID=441960 RepID=B6QQW8_TALMQ|nr:conserved hypothetical protein [Talaromyces marneffei ATCC 18224]
MATKPSTAATSSTVTAPSTSTSTSTSTTKRKHTSSTSALTFERKNTHLLHIPSKPCEGSNNKKYRIAKRPIPRAPVASPYVGSTVPKIVYVSSKTPFMSAVKRVQKLLRLAERRAMMPLIGKRRHSHHHQQYGAKGGGGDVLEKCQKKLREDKVLVKATGRAIEKALSVGRWFEEGKGGSGEEFEVVIRTGSVCVVDDIVEEDVEDHEEDEEDEEDGEEKEGSIDPDINMAKINTTDNTNEDLTTTTQDHKDGDRGEESKNQRRRRRKRERIREQRLKAFVDEDGETPESRTRWVNMVEVAINMK